MASASLRGDIEALVVRLGGPAMRVKSLVIGQRSVVLTVQDPARLGAVHRFSLQADGTWSGPSDVHLVGLGDLGDTLFGVEEVAWDRIGELMERTRNEPALQGGELRMVTVERTPGGSVEIRLSVTGSEGTHQLIASADGQPLAIQGG